MLTTDLQPATKRKPIAKRLRFEVFKRDKFKCKYCGRTAEEDVVLHVDHIIPVAKGGNNDPMNLITACENCNAGKSDVSLAQNVVASKTRAEAERRQELVEQLELMAQWRLSLKDSKEAVQKAVLDYWLSASKCPWWEEMDSHVKKWLRVYSPEECFEAIDIAVEQYLKYECEDYPTTESAEVALTKIYGIMKWRQRIKEDPSLEELYKIRSIARKRCPNYFVEWEALNLLKDARASGVAEGDLRDVAFNCTSYTGFRNGIENLVTILRPPESQEPVVSPQQQHSEPHPKPWERFVPIEKPDFVKQRKLAALDFVKGKSFKEVERLHPVFCDRCNKLTNAAEVSLGFREDDEKVEFAIFCCGEDECDWFEEYEHLAYSPFSGGPDAMTDFSIAFGNQLRFSENKPKQLSDTFKRLTVPGYDLVCRLIPALIEMKYLDWTPHENELIFYALLAIGATSSDTKESHQS